MKKLKKTLRYERRKRRVRSKIFGTTEVPRLSVFRSNSHIYAQLVDDENGKTLVSASDAGKSFAKDSKITKTAKAEKVGEQVAKSAVSKKIKKVIFDRNGFKYHGRVKALAEASRKGGLEF